MTKEQLAKALIVLSETIGFCRYELRACPGSEGLKENIDNLVELRKHLVEMYTATVEDDAEQENTSCNN